MKFLKRLIIVVLLLVGGAYFYGRSLPREHKVSSSIFLVASADTVWKTIRNIQGTPAWWSDMKSVTRVRDARRETWTEDMGSMVLTIDVTSEVPGSRLVRTIQGSEELGWGGVWTYDLVASGSGTQVTITEEGFIEKPLFRVLMNLMGQHRTMDSYLSSLGGHFGEPVTPRHGSQAGT